MRFKKLQEAAEFAETVSQDVELLIRPDSIAVRSQGGNSTNTRYIKYAALKGPSCNALIDAIKAIDEELEGAVGKWKMLSRSMAPVTNPDHCDNYIDDESQPKILRDWLKFYRSPAGDQMSAPVATIPICIADYKGDAVRLTMASRMGDIGISYSHDATRGYAMRVALNQLSSFRGISDER